MKRSVKKVSVYGELCKTAYPVERKDLVAAAKVMASAFYDDPSIRYLLGGEKEGDSDWKYFHCVLKAIYGKCVILSTDKSLNNLLVLFPPELKAVPTLSFLLKGGIRLCSSFGLNLFFRSLSYEKNCQAVKSRFMTPRTWYCMCFVVSPKMQKQGLGSQLIKPVLNVFSEHKIPLYLETHKAVNVSIYTHLGFETVDITTIPTTNIIQSTMMKE